MEYGNEKVLIYFNPDICPRVRGCASSINRVTRLSSRARGVRMDITLSLFCVRYFSNACPLDLDTFSTFFVFFACGEISLISIWCQ